MKEANSAATGPDQLRHAEEQEDMVLSEFDAPRSWAPAGELSVITALAFLIVALIAWLR